MKRIKELDGLRAVAILAVLGCHYAGFAALGGGVLEFGWVGVDIFFVLSGYLITTILLDLRGKPHPYKTFYSRRMIRIFPPYFAITFITIIAGLLMRQRWTTSSGFLLRQFLFLQAYFPEHVRFLRTLILHGPVFPNLLQLARHLPLGDIGLQPSAPAAFTTYWSLSIEEYFYLLWAPVVLRSSPRVIAVIAGCVCMIEILLRWCYADQLAYFGLFFRMDALMYGAILAMIFRYWRGRIPSAAGRGFAIALFAAVVGLAIILGLLWPVLGREIRESPLMLAFGLPMISVAAASVIGTLALRAESSWWGARLMRSYPMQYIGTISYTMYLVHVFAGTAVYFIFAKLIPGELHGERGWVQFTEAILSTILTITLARLSWVYMERPLLQWKDRRFPAHRQGPTKLEHRPPAISS